ncbi:MAG: hypothetical protein ABIC68_08555 [Candidatus Omnitrophota bacterium]
MEKTIKRLKQKLIAWRVVSFVLFIAFLATSTDEIWFDIKDSMNKIFASRMDRQAPYFEKVTRIINPLCYNGIPSLMHDDVRMSVDFMKKSWRLSNIHRFDERGDIILENGRNGLCFELSSYVYDKIRPLFPPAYQIKFLRTVESGFFFSGEGSHIVLCIIKPSLLGDQPYILDPSFRRYGKIEDFEDYIFFEEGPCPLLVKGRDTDLELSVDAAMPLVIKKDYMLWMGVESVLNNFDPDNYSISIVVNRWHSYFVKTLFSIRKKAGKVEETENKDLALLLMKPEDYALLKEKVKIFHEQVEAKAKKDSLQLFEEAVV